MTRNWLGFNVVRAKKLFWDSEKQVAKMRIAIGIAFWKRDYV